MSAGTSSEGPTPGMLEPTAFQGGCLCEDLRYCAEREPLDVGYCHCRICQRSTGSPVLVWASFPTDAFAYRRGSPAIYRSSSHGQREFCSRCGCQIAYREIAAPTSVDVNLASFDDPELLEPRRHIFTESRICWFDTSDDLPRFPDAGPQEAGAEGETEDA